MGKCETKTFGKVKKMKEYTMWQNIDVFIVTRKMQLHKEEDADQIDETMKC